MLYLAAGVAGDQLGGEADVDIKQVLDRQAFIDLRLDGPGDLALRAQLAVVVDADAGDDLGVLERQRLERVAG